MHMCYHSIQDLKEEGGQFNVSLCYRKRLSQILLPLLITIFIQKISAKY